MDEQRFILSDKGLWSLWSRNNTRYKHPAIDPNVDAIQLDPISRRFLIAALPTIIRANNQWHPEQQAWVAPVVTLRLPKLLWSGRRLHHHFLW
jgi:hypothetical protein